MLASQSSLGNPIQTPKVTNAAATANYGVKVKPTNIRQNSMNAIAGTSTTTTPGAIHSTASSPVVTSMGAGGGGGGGVLSSSSSTPVATNPSSVNGLIGSIRRSTRSTTANSYNNSNNTTNYNTKRYYY
jgi:hypothetical protein